ncbi:MAG: zinc ribbon-containing protein [Thalassotalea sp.]
MTDDKNWLKGINNHLIQWVDEIKQSELLDINEFLQQARHFLVEVEHLSEDKLSQFMHNLQHDLSEFYQQTKVEAKHSVYLGVMTEAWWQNLAEMTDKSQVEWAELADDIKHHGEYKTGDIIGFGILQCQQCSEHLHITHLCQVSDCINCGHQVFNRVLLNP